MIDGDDRAWVKRMQRRMADYDAKMMKHAAGLIFNEDGDQEILHTDVRRLVDVGLSPADLPAAPWGPIFEPAFLSVIKPMAIFHPCAWPLREDALGDRVMSWARELGRPLYVTQDFSNWLFVSLEPFPAGKRTVCRALATPEGSWELLD